MNTKTDWQNLLIDAAIAKNQNWIQNEHRGLRIQEVDSILASGLLIRAVSILDEAIENYINENGISVQSRNPKLYDRLKALKLEGLLVDYEDIDSWRRRRNDVGHEIAETYTWEEVDKCFSSIFRELNSLSILESYPQLNVKMTKKRVDPSEPNVLIEQQVNVVVHEGDQVFYEFGWRIQSKKRA
jgi:hypothetical protein